MKAVSRSTNIPTHAITSQNPASIIVSFASNHQRRGASGIPKRPLSALIKQPLGTPGNPSRGCLKYRVRPMRFPVRKADDTSKLPIAHFSTKPHTNTSVEPTAKLWGCPCDDPNCQCSVLAQPIWKKASAFHPHLCWFARSEQVQEPRADESS